MIDLTIHEDVLQRSLERARKNHIVIPTFAQMKNPDLIPDKIKERLKGIGLWDISPDKSYPRIHGSGPENKLCFLTSEQARTVHLALTFYRFLQLQVFLPS